MNKKEVTQLSYQITGSAIKVHKALGPGLLETVYEKCMKHDLVLSGHKVVQQVSVPVHYAGLQLATKLKVDLLVNDCIVVELKAIDKLLPVHTAQLMTYMKLLEVPQGLLINFFTDNISKSMKPMVNEYFEILPES